MAKNFAISFNNWDEHQERADRSNYTWFKFFSKTVDGHIWLNTDNDAFRVLVYLMCKRNALEGKVFHFSDEIIAAHCKVKARSVEKIIDHLVSVGAITRESGSECRHDPGKIQPNAVLDKSREDKKRGEESAAAPPRPTPSPLFEDEEAREAKAWGERMELEEAEEHYCVEYQKTQKTRARPFMTEEERQALEALYRTDGMTLEKLKLLITTYLWMENEWFDKKGRSLVTLKKELSLVFSKIAPTGRWPAATQPQGATA